MQDLPVGLRSRAVIAVSWSSDIFDSKRRIKCDETRPACVKCVQAGWQCDGFATSQSNSTSSAVITKTTIPTLAISRYSIPFQIPGSQKDRQLLHYFCVQGSQELAAFLNLDFWTRTVLEQSHQEATVRQALISLSALHLNLTTDPHAENGMARDGTLAQYGKALRMLQRRMKMPDTEAATKTALVCSVLFCCFEATLGNNEAATHHLRGGMNMLLSCHDQGTERTDDLCGITQEFERLELQAKLFYDQPVADSVPPWDDVGGQDYDVQPFQRLSDAHSALVRAFSLGWVLMCDNTDHRFTQEDALPESILREKRRLRGMLVQWKSAYDKFEGGLGEVDRAGYGHQILLVHWQIALMLIDAVFPADLDVWGMSPNPRAATMLELIENIVNTASWSCEPGRRTVSSEMGVVAPLFALALKCADPQVSDGAFRLLCSMQRREGLWEASHLASQITKLREAREGRFAPQGEAALADARGLSLEMLFYDELSTAEGLFKIDRRFTYLEQVAEALYRSFGRTKREDADAVQGQVEAIG